MIIIPSLSDAWWLAKKLEKELPLWPNRECGHAQMRFFERLGLLR